MHLAVVHSLSCESTHLAVFSSSFNKSCLTHFPFECVCVSTMHETLSIIDILCLHAVGCLHIQPVNQTHYNTNARTALVVFATWKRQKFSFCQAAFVRELLTRGNTLPSKTASLLDDSMLQNVHFWQSKLQLSKLFSGICFSKICLSQHC